MFLDNLIKRDSNTHGGLIEVKHGLIMLGGELIIRFVIVILNAKHYRSQYIKTSDSQITHL